MPPATLKPVRLKDGLLVRVCLPELGEGEVRFYCLGRLASLAAASTLGGLRSAFGKLLVEKLLERMGAGSRKPYLTLGRSCVKNSALKRYELLGVEVLALEISCGDGREYRVDQADTLAGYKETITAIWEVLRGKMGAGLA